jgi:asparagine synthase (glutamine-hydrolysing)
MCGILGVANVSGVPIPRVTIEKMRDTMAHRGPDDVGLYSDACVTLAHRRLSIIDLGGGHQPMSNPEETVWVIHNGEIYNFLDVRRELEAAGLTFRTNSDTEVIIRAYEKWGEGCVERLHGIFAFAIWDTRLRRLLVARDRLGIKPLFYAATRRCFYFGSEIKGFLADPEFDRSIDPTSVDRYFTFGYIPAPDTIFQHVKKLMPAHYLVWEDGRTRIARYWRFEPRTLPEDDEKYEEDWLEELREVLRKAVARQMVSDVPLGAFLSGGIDSSLVVRMMSEVSSTPVRTFTIGFGDDKTSETPYAKMVAERFLTNHTEFQVTPERMEEILPKLVWHLDEPFADSSAIPTYYVSKITRERVTVALSGDGGDELFAGYTRHQGERLSEQFRSFPSWIRSGALAFLGSPVARHHAGLRRLGHVLSNAEMGFITRYYNKEMLSQEIDRRRLYSQAFRSVVGERDVVTQLDDLARYTSKVDSIGRLTVFDLEFYLPNDMLVKVDKMSMASSLEVRVPFLDEMVMDIAARIPSDLKLKGYTTKYLLRKLVAESLPKEIFKRKKQGFGIPLQSWFRGELTKFAKEMLFDTRTLSRGYFAREAIETVLEDHEQRRFDHGHMIYALLVFELWNRTFVDGGGV